MHQIAIDIPTVHKKVWINCLYCHQNTKTIKFTVENYYVDINIKDMLTFGIGPSLLGPCRCCSSMGQYTINKSQFITLIF